MRFRFRHERLTDVIAGSCHYRSITMILVRGQKKEDGDEVDVMNADFPFSCCFARSSRML